MIAHVLFKKTMTPEGTLVRKRGFDDVAFTGHISRDEARERFNREQKPTYRPKRFSMKQIEIVKEFQKA